MHKNSVIIPPLGCLLRILGVNSEMVGRLLWVLDNSTVPNKHVIRYI